MELLIEIFKRLRLPIVILGLCLVGGAFGYHLIFPQETWSRLFFMTAITLSTTGYGDILNVASSPLAMAYTVLLILVGLSIVLYAVSTVTGFFLEGNLLRLLRKNKIQRKVKRMKNHYILCGGGQTGIHVVREFALAQVPYVLVEQSEKIALTLKQEFPQLLYVLGDATTDSVLHEAGLAHAQCIIAALSNDKDNLFLTLTARALNDKVKIIAKVTDHNLQSRFKKAGAHETVCPNFFGGMRIVSASIHSNAINYLDRILRGQDNDMRIFEVSVPPSIKRKSEFDLDSLQLREKIAVNVIAVGSEGHIENLSFNPSGKERLKEGSILLFIGTKEQKRLMIDILT